MIRLKNTSSLKNCAPCFYTTPNSLSLVLSYAFPRNPENFLSNSQFFRSLPPPQAFIFPHLSQQYSYSFPRTLLLLQASSMTTRLERLIWVQRCFSGHQCQLPDSVAPELAYICSEHAGPKQWHFEVNLASCVPFFSPTFMGLVSWKIDVFWDLHSNVLLRWFWMRLIYHPRVFLAWPGFNKLLISIS